MKFCFVCLMGYLMLKFDSFVMFDCDKKKNKKEREREREREKRKERKVWFGLFV